MARLMDMRKLRDGYVASVAAGSAAWIESQQASSSRRKTVAEDIFLRYAVGWESFASEWFIGAVNHDATRLARSVEKRMKRWLEKEVATSPYTRWNPSFPPPTISLRRQPRVDEVRALLDAVERNLDFASFEPFCDRAHKELAPRFAARVQALVDAGADEVVDAALAIRNVLAHRSVASVKTMNARVAGFTTYPVLRKKRMSSDGIGTYLAASTVGGEARLEVFARELTRVASALVP